MPCSEETPVISPSKRPRPAEEGGLRLRFVRLSEHATAPTKGSARAAGYDLYRLVVTAGGEEAEGGPLLCPPPLTPQGSPHSRIVQLSVTLDHSVPSSITETGMLLHVASVSALGLKMLALLCSVNSNRHLGTECRMVNNYQ